MTSITALLNKAETQAKALRERIITLKEADGEARQYILLPEKLTEEEWTALAPLGIWDYEKPSAFWNKTPAERLAAQREIIPVPKPWHLLDKSGNRLVHMICADCKAIVSDSMIDDKSNAYCPDCQDEKPWTIQYLKEEGK